MLLAPRGKVAIRCCWLSITPRPAPAWPGWWLSLPGTRGGPAVRLLILARSAGEWWQQLIASCDMPASDALAAVTPLTLGSLTGPSGQDDVFAEALAAFAMKLGRDCPAAQLPLVGADAVVLVVHAAALLAVLEDALPAGSAAALAEGSAAMIERLLWHEARYWQRSQAGYGLNLGPALTRRVMAAGALIGADDEASAVRLLAAIDDLADPETRGRAARWLHDLYPVTAPGTEWIGDLRPDLVAEHLVVGVLADQPALTASLVTGLPRSRASRALTILARAALADPAASDVLAAALDADLAHLAEPAMSVAVETNRHVGDLLAAALTSQRCPPDLATTIRRVLPERTIALAQTAVAVLQQLAAASQSDTEQHGQDLADLSYRLAEIGRRDDALAAISQAATIFRRLAADQSTKFLPDLARVLNGQSNRLAQAGQLEDALAPMAEAVAIRRRLAEHQPREFLPDLAASLNDQSIRLSDLGCREDALALIDEAVTIRRGLADQDPGTHLPVLALSLNNQSNRLRDLGRRADAVAVIDQAVAIRRELAGRRPDAYLPDLALALTNQAVSLYELGRHEDGLTAVCEAVSAYRQLTAYQPEAFTKQFTAALNNQSVLLAELGRHAEALTAITEAVTINRQLAAHQPDAFLPDLGMRLNTLSDRLADCGRRHDAAAAATEAVGIFRQLAAQRPEAYRDLLAICLDDQSRHLAGLERHDDALTANGQAVTTWRQLAAERPAVFGEQLKTSLLARAALLASMDRKAEAAAIRVDAAQLE